MLAAGMPPFPPGHPVLNAGRIVRYGPKKKAWYRLTEMRTSAGAYVVTGAYGIWQGMDSGAQKIEVDWKGVNAEERERLQRQRADAEAAEQAKAAQRARFAAGRASEQYKAGSTRAPDGVQTYLDRKGVSIEAGLKYAKDGTLLVPMIRYDVTREQELDPDYTGPRRLVGLQKIEPGGGKLFNKGMAKEGAACRLGKAPKRGEAVLVVEGVATGLSVRMATKQAWPVFVAFDAGNLLPVAKVLRALYPDSPIVFCADDDAYLVSSMNRVLRDNFGVLDTVVPPATALPVRTADGQALVSADWTADGDGVQGIVGAVTIGDRVVPLTRSNAGRVCAYRAAAAVGNASVLAPVFDNRVLPVEADAPGPKLTDFNDLHAVEGVDRVTAQFEAELARLEFSRAVQSAVKGEVARIELSKRDKRKKVAKDIDGVNADAANGGGSGGGGRLPVICYKAGNLPDIVDQAEAALIASEHDPIYQRGPLLVRVVRREAISLRNFERPVKFLGVTTVDKHYLGEQFCRCATWKRWDSRAEDWRPSDAPEKIAQHYMARGGHWRLRHLNGTISAPTLRPDGSLLQKEGYDTATGTYYDACGVTFKPVPDDPTKKQMHDAADRLFRAVDSLPFVSPADASVMVSLMLTSLVRRSLPSAPMGAITAPTPGSGKTLIADCIATLATGTVAPATQFPNDDQEAEKVVLSVLMAGMPLVMFDNVSRPLEGDWFCSVLTSESHQGRLLGVNDVVSVPTTTLFLATGNKLVIKGDLRTRALLCRIDPKHEKPEDRSFAVDLRVQFARERAELVYAALTLMRGYLANGEKAGVFRPWGRFETWSRFCREPLMSLGLSDPCESYDLIAQDDPDRQEHLRMLATWADYFHGEAKTASEAISASAAASDLRDALDSVAGERGGGISSKRLGYWLRSHADRIVDGRMFVRSGNSRDGVMRWQVAAGAE